MTTHALYVPEMIEATKQRALTGALERLLDRDAVETVWPAAFAAKQSGVGIPLDEVEIIVLPLDRIGAPPGASGSNVYISYYAHAPKTGLKRAVSPPLVVKIGKVAKLLEEQKGASGWPPLAPKEAGQFARPIHLDQEDAEWGVLLSPFHSEFNVSESGNRNHVKVRDLWQLLDRQNELRGHEDDHWEKVRRCVAQALDAVHKPHCATFAKPVRKKLTYGGAYKWYLRGTTDLKGRCYIPNSIFGSEPTVQAFGQTWCNPAELVEELTSSAEFIGHVGAVHGDLHPKNIVLDHEDVAQIIDFGWASGEAHIVQDYLLLDLNLRGTTLPSQIAETDVLALASFLSPAQDIDQLPEAVQKRAAIIKDVIWKRAQDRAVEDWEKEYLIPLLLVGYGLLVFLDSARNQPALVATVLAATREIRKHYKPVAA
jgi:hypothetical protein